MLTVYLGFAAWFWLIDMMAGGIAKSPCRPVAGAFLALFWPVSVAAAMLAAARIIRRYRDIGVYP